MILKRISTHLQAEESFTLVELMVGVAILSIALIGFGFAFSHGLAMIREIREISAATEAIQEQMEWVRDQAFDAIVDKTFTAPPNLNEATGTLSTELYGDDDVKKVTVTLNWTSLRDRSLNRSLVTLVTRNGINKK